MKKLSGRRVLVTGASGVVAFPVAVSSRKPTKSMRSHGSPTPSKAEASNKRAPTRSLLISQIPTVALPESVDVVINYAVLPPTHKSAYEVNAGATGRLARRYRDCEAFVHGSTASLYAYQGERHCARMILMDCIAQRRITPPAR